MDRSRRILHGGWLDNAVSVFTRGWYGGGIDVQGRICVSALALLPQVSAVALLPDPACVHLLPLPGALASVPSPTAAAKIPQPGAAVVECS